MLTSVVLPIMQDMAASYDDPSEVAAAGRLSLDSLLNGVSPGALVSASYFFVVLELIAPSFCFV